jgi:hypothetical protein
VLAPLAAGAAKSGVGGGSAAAAAASAGPVAEDEMVACTIRSSDNGCRSNGGMGQGCDGAASGCLRQIPYHLSLYLLCSEVLPGGVLRVIAQELQALLPVRRHGGVRPGAGAVACGAGPSPPAGWGHHAAAFHERWP